VHLIAWLIIRPKNPARICSYKSKTNQLMANTKTILSFVAGAAIGAIAGILFAPDSGANTRRKIAEKPGDVKDTVKNNILSWLDKLRKDVDGEVKREGGDNPAATMRSGVL
jgi:YtxH-like protein